MTSSIFRRAFVALITAATLAPAYDGAAEPSVAIDAATGTYYVARQDFRRCISPVCGGVFIHAVNRRSTLCADGTRAEECYVGQVDISALGLNDDEANEFQARLASGEATVQGKQRLGAFPDFPEIAELVVRAGWTAATSDAPKGIFARLADNGIVCITVPCFHIDSQVLNRRRGATISSLDLSGVGADPADEQAAFEALEAGDLLAAGKYRKTREGGRRGMAFVASQFYLPAAPSLSGCSTCTIDEICIDDPWDSCFGCSCPTTCASVDQIFCGGIAGFQCPKGLTCIDDPRDTCDPDCGGADCGGLCVGQSERPRMCGGLAGFECPLGLSCVDHKGDRCSPACGGADCGGVCVGFIGDPCGGFAGTQCGEGLICVDPLGDGCDNSCGGVCISPGSVVRPVPVDF